MKLINAEGIGQTILNNKKYYVIVGKSPTDDLIGIVFDCKENYKESVEKAFSRLIPVRVFDPEAKKEEQSGNEN